MTKIEENRVSIENNPMNIFLEAMTYFLAGGFVLKTISPRIYDINTGNFTFIIDILTFVIGWISIIAGIYCILITIFRSERKIEWYRKHKYWFLFVLFPITVPQIVPLMLNSGSYSLMFQFSTIESTITSLISIFSSLFLLLLLVGIVVISYPFLKNILYLLGMAFLFAITAILRYYQAIIDTEQTTNYDVMIYITICSILILAAMQNYVRNREHQLNLGLFRPKVILWLKNIRNRKK
jgi:uncharacterized membrane protein YidH (DUF202 family)